jgi:hypothetical protein
MDLKPSFELEKVWVVFTMTFWLQSIVDKQPLMDLLEISSPTEYFNIELKVRKTGSPLNLYSSVWNIEGILHA